MCLQVVIAALYYDPQLLLNCLETMRLPNSDQSLTAQFIKQWLHDCDCFLGLHDRKICVLGLCCLMDTPGSRPESINANSDALLPAAIMIFNGLKRAYEQRAAEEKEDSDDDEEEDEEEYVEGELDDDDDEIEEDSVMYIERLRKLGKKIDANGDHNDDDDAESDLDSDEAEETALESYETPLDKTSCTVDEYQIFKTLLETIEQRDAEWYAALVRPLTSELKKDLQEVFKLADQRRAAQESKSIEKKGGYTFQQRTVPSAFNFTSP